jgi:EAL domain-containing protein (putative c-di-GMP-specific phosphodiesterase class I)
VLAPAAFVPLAEEAGLATSIGQWVLGEACDQVARWNLGGVGDGMLRVAVNVSPEQLTDTGFARRVEAVLDASGLDASLLTLEITEAVLEDESPAVAGRLEGLREIGVQVALDDFGTGLSSLARLGEAPVDVLKIPGEFLRSDADSDRPGLAEALVTLGRTLGLPTVAESVETDGQLSRLARIGCRYAQGHVFAQAMPASELEAWIRAGGASAPDSAGRGAGARATR